VSPSTCAAAAHDCSGGDDGGGDGGGDSIPDPDMLACDMYCLHGGELCEPGFL
jgi:hypothetical protein